MKTQRNFDAFFAEHGVRKPDDPVAAVRVYNEIVERTQTPISTLTAAADAALERQRKLKDENEALRAENARLRKRLRMKARRK